MPLFTAHEVSQRGSRDLNKIASFAEGREISKLLKPSLPITTKFDIFISHRSGDSVLIEGIYDIITKDMNLSAYVDWIHDPQLDRSAVSRATASVLRRRMNNCKSMLFVSASEQQGPSLWMPWELGYMDGLNKRVAILPIVQNPDTTKWKGQEYLGLYPYISKKKEGTGMWVYTDPENPDPKQVTEFLNWIQ